jgi:PAS domain S-box-containing protein
LKQENISSLQKGNSFFSNFYEKKGIYYRSYFLPVLAYGYKDYVFIKVEAEQTFLARLEKASPLLVGLRTIGIVAILVITYLFVTTAVKPLRQLSQEVQSYRMASSASADEDTSKEMDLRLALDTFREMVNELQEKEKVLQELYASAEQRAEKLKNYNDYILESISSGVISLDTEGKITVFNQAAEHIIGISEREARHLSIEDLFGENRNVIELLQHSLEKGREHNRVEISYRNRNGRLFWLNVSSSILKDDEGNTIGTTFLLFDITEIKKLQEQINLKERLSALGEMAAGIAHEFRNSLASIIGYARLLKKRLPKEDERTELLNSIMKESKAQEQIVRQFLDFTRPTSLNLQKINLIDVLDEAICSIQNQFSPEEKEEYKILKDYEEDEMNINGDFTLLRQVFSNIILNGIEAMPRGGALSVSVSKAEDVENRPVATISISDTGVGINEEDNSRIFTPFFTTKEKGTGLGLALSHKIITQHEGNIDFISDGRSTVFFITLPLYSVV